MNRIAVTVGVLAIFALGGSTDSEARSSYHSKRKTSYKKKGPKVRLFVSPNGRHVASVDRLGQVRIDGRRVRLNAGRIWGPPIWRPDSKALAFLHRAGYRTNVVVLVGLDHRNPLIWPLSAGQRLTKLFWVSQRRLGAGVSEMVPRVVFSWTTEVL